MKLFRRIKAFILQTFVADCPVCHKHFYGYHPHMQHVRIKDKHYRIVCHKCAKSHIAKK